jgi:hypothetical protein
MWVVAGCGADSHEQTFSAGDLRRIAAVGPTTPGWDWPRQPRPSHSSAEASSSPAETDPSTAAFLRRLDKAGDIAGEGSRWEDRKKLSALEADVFRSPAGAHKGLAAFRAFARVWAKRGGGTWDDVLIDGLGDEAWRIHQDAASGQLVTFGWRRADLVLQIHIQCVFSTCPSDISQAGRAWADAIDEEARAGP